MLKKLLAFVQEQIQLESGQVIYVDEVLSTYVVPIMQQDNDYDCGLYLLEFAEKFLFDNFQKGTVQPLTETGVAINCDKKRQQIKELIERLSALQFL